MKKSIVITGVVIAVLIGIIGGVAMAAPTAKPPDTWQYIADTVEEILSRLTDTESGLAVIDSKLSSLSNNESSMARFMSDQGIIDCAAEIHDEMVFESPVFDEGAHFHVSVWITGDVDIGDHVKIHHGHLSQDGSYWSSSAFHVETVDFHTYEFDGAYCGIAYTNYDDTHPLEVRWAVTITYASSSIDD
jgi:hypothetical protein